MNRREAILNLGAFGLGTLTEASPVAAAPVIPASPSVIRIATDIQYISNIEVPEFKDGKAVRSIITTAEGCIYHLNANGILHREDGPALIYHEDHWQWCKDGLAHRDDGPAIYHKDHYEIWCQNGNRHRLDGPAVIFYKEGRSAWYQNGELNRIDGPAIEYANGDAAWYEQGELNRIDGHAFQFADGSGNWYIQGKPCPSSTSITKTTEPSFGNATSPLARS